MSSIKLFIKKIFCRDNLIIAISTLLLLVTANFVYVFYSPQLVGIMPLDFVRNTSTCYRTLFHLDKVPKSTTNKLEVVFGDSYAEGSGVEFLTGKSDYGIFNKLEQHERKFVIFGRSGFGNIGTSIEEARCAPLLDSYTSFEFERSNSSHITFVFYEGNDLNNNLYEADHTSNPLFYKVRFFLPLFEYTYKKLRKIFRRVKSTIIDHIGRKTTGEEPKIVLPTSVNGIEIGIYPQSAATELSENETLQSLEILQRSLAEISDRYPNAKKHFLYLPSVASSYDFKGPLRVQSYKGEAFYETSGEINRAKSDELRYEIELIANRTGWKFCDATSRILNITRQGKAVHGPRDWKHFNEIGYTAVKDTYLDCLSLP